MCVCVILVCNFVANHVLGHMVAFRMLFSVTSSVSLFLSSKTMSHRTVQVDSPTAFRCRHRVTHHHRHRRHQSRRKKKKPPRRTTRHHYLTVIVRERQPRQGVGQGDQRAAETSTRARRDLDPIRRIASANNPKATTTTMHTVPRTAATRGCDASAS